MSISGDPRHPLPALDAIGIPEGLPPVVRGPSPLPGTLNGKSDDDIAEKAQQVDTRRKLALLDVQDRTNEVENRKTYTDRLFYAVVIWMGFVGLLVIISGARCKVITLSDPVLITLLGTTTLNVIGVFVIVAKYLFPPRGGATPPE